MVINIVSTSLPTPSLNWDTYNELLVDRNDLTRFYPQLHEGFRNLDQENQKDPQHPKKYPEILFQILAYAKSYQRIKWRDTVGTARTLCVPFKYPVPCFATIFNRCQELDLKSLLGKGVDAESESEKMIEENAIDDTGLKEKGPGEWLKKIHHPKKHRSWLKFHAIINTHNRKIRAYGMTSSSVKGKQVASKLIHRAQRKRKMTKLFGDGEYDYKPLYNEAETNCFEVVFRPRKDASTKAKGSPARARYIWKVKQAGWTEWKKVMEYGHRWTIEIAFSAFKRIFGDHVYSKKISSLHREIQWKVQIYNDFMNSLNESL